MASGYALGRHIREAHWKGKKKWVNCWKCWAGYSSYFSVPILFYWKLTLKKYNYTMSEAVSWVLIIIGISIPPIIAVLLDHYFKRKKRAAETKKIQLENKITEEITYGQLKSESKHKDIKNKIEILKNLNKFEGELKQKENKTESDQKKLESLEMIKKEFGQTFFDGENMPQEAPKKLTKNNEKADKTIKSVGAIRQKNKKKKSKK